MFDFVCKGNINNWKIITILKYFLFIYLHTYIKTLKTPINTKFFLFFYLHTNYTQTTYKLHINYIKVGG